MQTAKHIYARNCSVRRIDSRTAADFLDANHRMGYARCQYRYGLFVQRSTGASESVYPAGTLVAAGGFSGARHWTRDGRRINSHEWVRYASLRDLRIVGGMGKMLEAFIDEVHPDDVMTYSEPGSQDGGRSYRRLGFRSEGIVTKPGFSCEKLRLILQ